MVLVGWLGFYIAKIRKIYHIYKYLFIKNVNKRIEGVGGAMTER